MPEDDEAFEFLGKRGTFMASSKAEVEELV